jgi:hypothetical protein
MDNDLYTAEGPRYCDMGRHVGQMVVQVRGRIYMTQEEYARFTTVGDLKISLPDSAEDAD